MSKRKKAPEPAESEEDEATTGVRALQAVLHHEEGQVITSLKEENHRLKKRLDMLEAIQVKRAATEDIFVFFNKINDPKDPTTSIDTLKEYRDFILEHCVSVQMPTVADTPCRFGTMGGHHPFTSSILKACQHYDTAIENHGKDNLQPQHWQWQPPNEPAMRCHQECLNADHMHVEPHNNRLGRYLNTEGFPFKWVAEAVIQVTTTTTSSSSSSARGRTYIPPGPLGNMWELEHR